MISTLNINCDFFLFPKKLIRSLKSLRRYSFSRRKKLLKGSFFPLPNMDSEKLFIRNLVFFHLHISSEMKNEWEQKCKQQGKSRACNLMNVRKNVHSLSAMMKIESSDDLFTACADLSLLYVLSIKTKA